LDPPQAIVAEKGFDMASPKMSPNKRSGSAPRPAGELRQSQMITTYGPGALVDLVDDAILISGLEHWSYVGAAGYELQEERLAENLRARGMKTLSLHAPFRAPPVSVGEDPHEGCGIKALEFPSWFLCPAKNCERLIHRTNTELKNGRRHHRCEVSDGSVRLVPVRFVTACRNGHLDDFPWNFFTHMDRPGGNCENPSLRLIDRGSGDLSDVKVKCDTCDASRSLAKARGEMALPPCLGKRPWLGEFSDDSKVSEPCTERQRLLVRTASNSYFSQVESALTIPKTSRLAPGILEFLQRHYRTIFADLESIDELVFMRKKALVIREAGDEIKHLSDAALWHAVETYRAEMADDERVEPVRETEYRSIRNARLESGNPRYSNADLEGDRNFTAIRPRLETSPLVSGLQDLVLLLRLRELRVLTGFTRLESPSQNIYGEFDIDSRVAALSLNNEWLPASEIRGEGFFIELDLERLRQWEKGPAVRAREEMLRQGFLTRFAPKDGSSGPVFPGIRFYLLHTLAHLLINEVSLACGYAASAIRERIYCSPPGTSESREMAGILISTGSAGSEGTLGGLVEQGRKVSQHLRRALAHAKLCSHDPVCARQDPFGGQSGRALLGAACHGCLFIAECSCERSNQYLDRALVVPTVTDSDVAFFGDEEVGIFDVTHFESVRNEKASNASDRGRDPSVAVVADPNESLDLEDFDEQWRETIKKLGEIPGIEIEAGGEIAKAGRVIGNYALAFGRGEKRILVVDAEERNAAKCVAALAAQGEKAIAFSPGEDDIADLLEALE
jgi:hypothetical protein